MGADVTQSQAAKLLGALALMAAGLSGAAHAAPTTPPPTSLIDDALIVAQRLNATPIDKQTLVNGALDGMMRTLDRGAEYISPQDYQAMIDLGQVVGLGLTTSTDDGVARIVALADGAPAAKGGLRLGDYIVAIDGHSVLGDTNFRVSRKLSGAPGSPVKVSIIRDMRERLDLTLVRDAVIPEGVTARLEGDYAYLRLGGLDERSTDKLDTGLRDLRREHPDIKGLVLDLRDNPGGLLDQAMAVSDAFLDSGQVFSQRGQKADENRRYTARPGDVISGLPMVVLINGGTAAGAEIIASALQDNHRARLVGTQSFGRGSIQTVVPLSGGADGALKVTTAYFYRPSGEAIEAVGVKPDVVAPKTAGPTDAQLARAIDLLKAGPGKAD